MCRRIMLRCTSKLSFRFWLHAGRICFTHCEMQLLSQTVCHFLQDERHVIFDCPACSHIRSRLANIFQHSFTAPGFIAECICKLVVAEECNFGNCLRIRTTKKKLVVFCCSVAVYYDMTWPVHRSGVLSGCSSATKLTVLTIFLPASCGVCLTALSQLPRHL